MHLVTKYLDCLGNTKLLPLKVLSITLAILFALSCPKQSSSLAKLDLQNCRVALKGVSFTLVSPRKRGYPDQPRQAFLCLFHTMRNYVLCSLCAIIYLKTTQNLCPVFLSSKPDPLFVFCVKPHNPITAPTLSRWPLHSWSLNNLSSEQ